MLMLVLWKRLLDQEDAGVELHYLVALVILLSIVIFTGYDIYSVTPIKPFLPLEFAKSVTAVIAGIAGANFGVGKQRVALNECVASTRPLPSWVPKWVAAMLDSNDKSVEFHVVVSLAVLVSYMVFTIHNFVFKYTFDVAGYGTGAGMIIGAIGATAWTAGMQRRDQANLQEVPADDPHDSIAKK